MLVQKLTETLRTKGFGRKNGAKHYVQKHFGAQIQRNITYKRIWANKWSETLRTKAFWWHSDGQSLCTQAKMTILGVLSKESMEMKAFQTLTNIRKNENLESLK